MAATQSEENPVDSKHGLNKRLCFMAFLLNEASVLASSSETGVEINGRHMRRRESTACATTIIPIVSKNRTLLGDL